MLLTKFQWLDFWNVNEILMYQIYAVLVFSRDKNLLNCSKSSFSVSGIAAVLITVGDRWCSYAICLILRAKQAQVFLLLSVIEN